MKHFSGRESSQNPEMKRPQVAEKLHGIYKYQYIPNIGLRGPCSRRRRRLVSPEESKAEKAKKEQVIVTKDQSYSIVGAPLADIPIGVITPVTMHVILGLTKKCIYECVCVCVCAPMCVCACVRACVALLYFLWIVLLV